jgi:hemerythrin-like domain-containing protein
LLIFSAGTKEGRKMESIVATFIHEIKNTLRGEPHTFNEIRYMIEDARVDETPFVEILYQHHRFLNESIAILIDRESDVPEKQLHLDRLLRLLDMHSHAEEETLYRSLSRHHLHDIRREAMVGQDEHAIIEQLSNELQECRYLTEWTDDIDAKAQVLSNVVANHIFEEESGIYPLAKKSLLPTEMQVLASDYLDLCEFYLDGDTRTFQPVGMTWSLKT